MPHHIIQNKTSNNFANFHHFSKSHWVKQTSKTLKKKNYELEFLKNMQIINNLEYSIKF